MSYVFLLDPDAESPSSYVEMKKLEHSGVLRRVEAIECGNCCQWLSMTFLKKEHLSFVDKEEA